MNRPDFQSILDGDQNNLMHLAVYQMDELMEKLKLLNYERLLLKDMKMKPLSRYYFVKSINPGEQFFMFTSLCAWLIRQTGRDFEQPQEFHDPTKTIANIIKILQDMDISIDFPTNKLMQGAGFICVYVLDCLATQAVKVNVNDLLRPEINSEEDVAIEMISNENEIILEKVEEEQNALLSDGSEDETNDLLNLKFNKSRANNVKDFSIYSNVNALSNSEQWRLELERVLPQLKVVVKTDPRDWRAHWEQMKIFRENINSVSGDTEHQLEKLQNDITFAMEKIESREKHLNAELSDSVQQFKSVSVEYSQVRNAIKELNIEKQNLEQQLEKTGHNFENIRTQMEQRGNVMSDGSPLINIKKAISKIKEEIIEMELEIGVLKYTVDQDILKQNAMYAEMEPMTSMF